MDIYQKLNKQKEILESNGYRVCYLALYGSQNYGLDVYTDDYKSDLDMKAIVVPTLDNLINGSKPISTVIQTEWGECDLKDIRSYFTTLLKGNPAYLETLFTEHFVVDESFSSEFENIFSLKDELVYTLRAQMIRAMYGMMKEKEKAMCHPYPTIKYKIDEFGYDGKQVSHAFRLWLIMQEYFMFGRSFEECLQPKQQKEIKFLLDLKLNKYPLEFAKKLMSEIMEAAKGFKDEVLLSIDESIIDYSVKFKFEDLSRRIIKNKIINDIRGE